MKKGSDGLTDQERAEIDEQNRAGRAPTFEQFQEAIEMQNELTERRRRLEKMSHTPNPWRVVPRNNTGPLGGVDWINIESGDKMVAEMIRTFADANLIAAAPRMLELLKVLRDSVPMDTKYEILVMQIIIMAEGK